MCCEELVSRCLSLAENKWNVNSQMYLLLTILTWLLFLLKCPELWASFLLVFVVVGFSNLCLKLVQKNLEYVIHASSHQESCWTVFHQEPLEDLVSFWQITGFVHNKGTARWWWWWECQVSCKDNFWGNDAAIGAERPSEDAMSLTCCIGLLHKIDFCIFSGLHSGHLPNKEVLLVVDCNNFSFAMELEVGVSQVVFHTSLFGSKVFIFMFLFISIRLWRHWRFGRLSVIKHFSARTFVAWPICPWYWGVDTAAPRQLLHLETVSGCWQG